MLFLDRIVLLLPSLALSATIYNSSYIEYTVGDFPLIISAPHGGTSKPSNFPDRHDGCKVDGKCVWPSPEDCASHDGCHVTTGVYYVCVGYLRNLFMKCYSYGHGL